MRVGMKAPDWMTQNLASWNDQREDIFLSILKKKKIFKKKYSMSDLVVYKIKGKILSMSWLFRLRDEKKIPKEIRFLKEPILL